MVRINLIDPKNLADQHLIAEYNEILMLIGHLKKHGVKSDPVPESYCLGKGHITFFKNKLLYLKKRHGLIKNEMRNRGFKTNKKLEISKYSKKLKNDWKPEKRDYETIKKRLMEKINSKPNHYRHYGEHKDKKFFINLINANKIMK